MPNTEVKCCQTRKFTELPYIILHASAYSKIPRVHSRLMVDPLVYGINTVGEGVMVLEI